MLVRLPHGMCVNPEIVKHVHVRPDRPNPRENTMVYNVLLKTDDDGFLTIAEVLRSQRQPAPPPGTQPWRTAQPGPSGRSYPGRAGRPY